MPSAPPPVLWRRLTPRQRATLRRLHRVGPLAKPDRWEMATVRSLVARGLLRSRDRARDGADTPGMWFLTARAIRLVEQVPGPSKPRAAGLETSAQATDTR